MKKLLKIKENVNRYNDIISNDGKTPLDAISELVKLRITIKEDRAIKILFKLMSIKSGKISSIIMTNKALSQQIKVFEDDVLVNAILNRVLHHSHVVDITGKSYRFKDYYDEPKNVHNYVDIYKH